MANKNTMSTYEKSSGGTTGKMKAVATPRLNKSNTTNGQAAAKSIAKAVGKGVAGAVTGAVTGGVGSIAKKASSALNKSSTPKKAISRKPSGTSAKTTTNTRLANKKLY